MADHYRERILSGALEPGSKLPSSAELSASWEVSTATVRRALQALAVERYLRATPRGTFVADEPRWTLTPRDRLVRVRRAGSFLAEDRPGRAPRRAGIRRSGRPGWRPGRWPWAGCKGVGRGSWPCRRCW
ncbi:winged helix-turn-helix domain-containing protein [Streptomyces sp. NPDC057702]|uniref:winged helix-turn-helix domain-containing protein n=1 Tax=unclassified Streptomyces TaxID=2593676 RepID=UPI0036CA4E73